MIKHKNVEDWISKHKNNQSDKEKILMHERFNKLLEEYKGRFYYRGAHTYHPEKYPPNELAVDIGDDIICITPLLCSCPCEICGHTLQRECYDNNCDCCSETCT